MTRIYTVLTTLVLLSLNLSAQETDSVKYNTLQEVVVESEHSWIEGNKAIFIPTKKEKNLSKDPTTLVESMHIPTVIVAGGQVQSYNGKPVTFFINGVKADEIDMTAFLTKDVKRVEYIENPSDPTYETVPVAINLVVTQYEVGGITKLDLNQILPNRGMYRAASKLVYKSMTYGMLLNGGYSRNHDSYSRGEDTYSDITYNGTKYDEISRKYDSHTVGRNDFMSASLNARWTGKIGRMTHTAGLMHGGAEGK